MIVKKTKNKSKSSKLIACFIKTFNEYSSVSSITGLKYIKEEKNLVIKVFWCLVIFVCFIFCNILVAHFWFRYKSLATRITVATNHAPLSSLKLPAITICSYNPLDANRSTIFIRQLKFNENKSHDELQRLLRKTESWFDNYGYDETELEALQNILHSNNYTMAEFMSLIQRPCADLLVKCQFQRSIVPCSSLFNVSLTQFGNCCTFNGNQEFNTSLHIEPRNTMSVIISPGQLSAIDSAAIKMYIHESKVPASASAPEKILSIRSEVFVRVNSVLNTCSAPVSELAIDDRKCLYPFERKLRNFREYRELKCKLECRLNIIIKYCNCLPYYYGKYVQRENVQICNFTQIKCLIDNYWSIHGNRKNYSLNCDCLANCNDYSYDFTTSVVKLHRNQNIFVDEFMSDDEEDVIVVHVSFGRQVFRIVRKDLSTNVLALTANLGGIYSLFIGFSAITFIEIFYYFCIRFYLNYRQ